MAGTGTTGKWVLAVSGSPIPDDVDQLVNSLVVDSSLNQPDMFMASFRDPGHVVLSKTGATIGSAVTVNVVTADSPGGAPLSAAKLQP